MFTWTETPLVEMWNQLRYLSSPANVRNLLSGAIKSGRQNALPQSNDLARRSHEIASCVRQADEYYRAADTVGLAVQPLLQFYGAESLAKASILANNDSVWLFDINFHGLSTQPGKNAALRQYKEDPSSWELEREFAVKKPNGVFPQLCSSMGDTVPPDEAEFTFKELLRVLPDLDNLFHRHYGELSNCCRIYAGPEEDADGNTEIYFSNNIGDVRSRFPEFETGFEESQYQSAGGFRSTSASSDPLSFGAVVRGTVAGRYFVRPVASGVHTSFVVLFAAMFVLSNVVRYKPAFWMQQLEGAKSGSVFVAEALCNLAKRRLPNDALESIWQERFIYGTPGYIT